MTTTPTNPTATDEAEALRAKARQCRQDAIDSFERSDTDGALSQWASGVTARLHDLQARIVERGGLYEFPALFTTDGDWVPAKVIDGQYGPCWMILDTDGNATGEFAPYRPKRATTLTKRGYREGRVLRPAKADTADRGSIVSVYVYAKATTPAHHPPTEVLSDGSPTPE